ncbi:MAG TPA: formate dehydrogenase accessory protein FdhE, partial [Symbiobacteriaceae bacterium]|nr:formate dehydrogenase accessory protein FdhE [Symbiobacteriaceae bacterium]
SYLSAYARSLPADLTTHRQARCPVCGRLPHMGHIDPNNIKYMHCPVCETTWRFARVGCVSCGNTNTDKLGFFTVEGDDERRVEHCSECAGYLKVINQRLGVREIDWLVEDAATQYLDQLAESEGYVRGGRVVAKH